MFKDPDSEPFLNTLFILLNAGYSLTDYLIEVVKGET